MEKNTKKYKTKPFIVNLWKQEKGILIFPTVGILFEKGFEIIFAWINISVGLEKEEIK